MYNLNDALMVGKALNVKFDKFTPYDLVEGLNIEKEHGFISPSTNVTNDNLILTAKIALAHLNEFPNYYNKEYGLAQFENFLKNKLKG